MNNLININLTFLFIIFAVECVNTDKADRYEIETQFNALWGKKIIINDSIFNTYCLTSYNNKKYRIVTSIDGDCSCSIEALEKWEKYKLTNKLVAKKTEVVIFITSEYDFLINEEIFKKIAPDICLIFDLNNTYVTMNKLIYKSNSLMTFLIDTTNTVKLIGNPVSNKKIKKLYQTYLFNN